MIRKADDCQSQHDYACPSCYLYHQPEIAHDTGAICFKIISRTPRAFIPYKEEGSYSADKSEQQEEESESLYVAQSQLGLRVDRIVLRIFLVKSAIYPLADRIEYHSRNDGDESQQEILRSVYIEADNAYDERAAADIYRRQLALYIVEISSLLNRILFSDLYISKRQAYIKDEQYRRKYRYQYLEVEVYQDEVYHSRQHDRYYWHLSVRRQLREELRAEVVLTHRYEGSGR